MLYICDHYDKILCGNYPCRHREPHTHENEDEMHIYCGERDKGVNCIEAQVMIKKSERSRVRRFFNLLSEIMRHLTFQN